MASQKCSAALQAATSKTRATAKSHAAAAGMPKSCASSTTPKRSTTKTWLKPTGVPSTPRTPKDSSPIAVKPIVQPSTSKTTKSDASQTNQKKSSKTADALTRPSLWPLKMRKPSVSPKQNTKNSNINCPSNS